MRVWNCVCCIQEILGGLRQGSAEGNIWIYMEERNGRLRRYKIMGSFTMFICSQHIYLLTYSMEQSSWEANWSAASQEIPCILWKPKVHHRTHKRTPPVRWRACLLRDASSRNTPTRRSEWGSNLPPDCFVSRGSISHMCFVTKVFFYREELLGPRPTPKLEDHPVSAVRDCLFVANFLIYLLTYSLQGSEPFFRS